MGMVAMAVRCNGGSGTVWCPLFSVSMALLCVARRGTMWHGVVAAIAVAIATPVAVVYCAILSRAVPSRRAMPCRAVPCRAHMPMRPHWLPDLCTKKNEKKDMPRSGQGSGVKGWGTMLKTWCCLGFGCRALWV